MTEKEKEKVKEQLQKRSKFYGIHAEHKTKTKQSDE